MKPPPTNQELRRLLFARRVRHERGVIDETLCTQAEWSAAWGALLRGAVVAELRRDTE